MGASFPIGVVAVRDPGFGTRDSKNSGSQDAGALYAMNTIGAALGAALTGFVLLPALGLFGTTLVGVALNAIAAVGALLLARRGLTADRSAERSTAIADPKGPRRSTDQPHGLFNHTIALPAVVLGVSGFVALVYEVTWTRILAMMLGPTTYAFSAMLVAFIAGLGIGSAVAAALVSRVRRPGVWLGAAMIATAAAGAPRRRPRRPASDHHRRIGGPG